MIVFDLRCSNGHTFEGWFEDGQAYEEQKEKSMITCPVCNDGDITKILSPFAIKTSRPVPKDNPASDEEGMAKAVKKIMEFVDKNFDDVGCNFAKEALKIHYGVSEPRNIRGSSTEEEEKTLKEEGVKFFKVPVPPQPDGDA